MLLQDLSTSVIQPSDCHSLAVDIFATSSWRYKIITKTCFALVLMIGLITTTTVTISYSEPDLVSDETRRTVVIISSLIGTCIASWVQYVNPSAKWLQLRGASLSIESEIWKVGAPYSSTASLLPN